jgi:predicted kinase
MATLIILCGTSFSGKTTLADRLAGRLGLPQVDVDETKTRLYGDGICDGALSGADWTRIYAETDRRIAGCLSAGESVIDASRNFSRRERDNARALCERQRAELVTIFVDTPVAITRQRWLANRQQARRRDVPDDDFNAILAGWEPPTLDEHPLMFRPSDDVEAWVERHAGRLVARARRPPGRSD